MTVKELKNLLEKVEESLEVYLALSASNQFTPAGSVSISTRKYELPSGKWEFQTKLVIGD